MSSTPTARPRSTGAVAGPASRRRRRCARSRRRPCRSHRRRRRRRPARNDLVGGPGGGRGLTGDDGVAPSAEQVVGAPCPRASRRPRCRQAVARPAPRRCRCRRARRRDRAGPCRSSCRAGLPATSWAWGSEALFFSGSLSARARPRSTADRRGGRWRAAGSCSPRRGSRRLALEMERLTRVARSADWMVGAQTVVGEHVAVADDTLCQKNSTFQPCLLSWIGPGPSGSS